MSKNLFSARRAGTLLASTILVSTALAVASAQEWQPAPPPPEMQELTDSGPPPVVDDAARQQQILEQADIILIEGPDETIREYWINNHLMMIEVIPAVGPPYYLIDTTGDGRLDVRTDGLGPNFVPPQWILFRW